MTSFDPGPGPYQHDEREIVVRDGGKYFWRAEYTGRGIMRPDPDNPAGAIVQGKGPLRKRNAPLWSRAGYAVIRMYLVLRWWLTGGKHA